MLERELRGVESRAVQASACVVAAERERVRVALCELLPPAVDAVMAPSLGPVFVGVPQGSTAGLLPALSLPFYPSAFDGSSLSTAVAPPVVTPPVSSLPTIRDSVTRRSLSSKCGSPQDIT